MACHYELTIKGINSGKGSISDPIILGSGIDSESDYTKEQLLQDLSKLPKSQLKELLNQIDLAEQKYKERNEPLKIKDQQKRVAIHQLTEHMK